MIKNIIASIMLGVSSMTVGSAIQSENTASYEVGDNKMIPLFYMYEVEHGTYWLDPLAESENVIWVDDETLEDWGISKRDLHHGNKYIGVFDSEGWELEGMKQPE